MPSVPRLKSTTDRHHTEQRSRWSPCGRGPTAHPETHRTRVCCDASCRTGHGGCLPHPAGPSGRPHAGRLRSVGRRGARPGERRRSRPRTRRRVVPGRRQLSTCTARTGPSLAVRHRRTPAGRSPSVAAVATGRRRGPGQWLPYRPRCVHRDRPRRVDLRATRASGGEAMGQLTGRSRLRDDDRGWRRSCGIEGNRNVPFRPEH
jgi:hypothetical protein